MLVLEHACVRLPAPWRRFVGSRHTTGWATKKTRLNGRGEPHRVRRHVKNYKNTSVPISPRRGARRLQRGISLVESSPRPFPKWERRVPTPLLRLPPVPC